MQNPNHPTPRTNNRAFLFIDYTLAELRKGKDWIIVYYAKNPVTKKLERQRLRVPKRSNAKIREKEAKRIIEELNNRLQNGWSPYFESTETFYANFFACTKLFLSQTEIDVKKQVKRPDTLRAYKSYISVITTYIESENIKIDFVIDFSKTFVVNYLDWLFYTRNVSTETWNNHLTFLTNFGNWLIGKGYIKELPTLTLKRKPKAKKVRNLISTDYQQKILEYLQENSFSYYVLTLIIYSCFIRRRELTLLKVENVKLHQNIIQVPASVSKNKKDEIVTIPNALVELLAIHLQAANNSDYLFSQNNFKPGKEYLNPKKISDYFASMRNTLNLPKDIQFYSWKDTGITAMFEAGFPLIKIRNQARHYDISMTEKYTHRNIEADQEIKNNSLPLTAIEKTSENS